MNGQDFICKTKPSWESLHICYSCTPSCTCRLRRVSWIVKGSYSKNTSPFSSSYSTKLGRGQVLCILQQTWDFKCHCHFIVIFRSCSCPEKGGEMDIEMPTGSYLCKLSSLPSGSNQGLASAHSLPSRHPFLCKYCIYPEVGEKNPLHYQTYGHMYFLLLEDWNSLISISKVNFHTVGILSYMAKCNPHIPAIFHDGKQTVQK